MTRGRRGSLGLRRRALPSPPPGRFIPAHPPSLHPHYRGFTATRRSAPLPRIGTLPLAVSAAWGPPSRRPRQHAAEHITARGSHVPHRRLTRAHATFVPDTTWPINRHPPGSSRGNNWTPVSMSSLRLRHFSQWFTHVRLLGSHLTPSRTPFPQRSPPRLIHRRSLRWFATSPCRAVAEGPPPSPMQHRIRRLRLLHRNLPLRSWRTVVGVTAGEGAKDAALIAEDAAPAVLGGKMQRNGFRGDVVKEQPRRLRRFRRQIQIFSCQPRIVVRKLPAEHGLFHPIQPGLRQSTFLALPGPVGLAVLLKLFFRLLDWCDHRSVNRGLLHPAFEHGNGV
jgi:hypothetical protein